MAQKKKKKKAQPAQKPMSPERYIREAARKLPIGNCYITPGWEEQGLCHIVVSRVKPSGNVVAGAYLVDTFCLGLKDSFYYADMNSYEFKDLLDKLGSFLGLESISYNEAHNIIYGAIGYAEDAGISPDSSFATTEYILEEDTDDVPLIEYEFGKDGKHFLVVSSSKEKQLIEMLQRNLGNDFDYEIAMDEDDDDSGIFDWGRDTGGMEEFSYDYPEYPTEISVKNSFIADELRASGPDHMLPKEAVERILALPADEAAADISNVVLYEIGRTYETLNDGSVIDDRNDALLYAIMLLTQLRSEAGLDAVLEIMCQNEEFIDCHLGDLGIEYLPAALYACGKDNVEAIKAYIFQPGHDSFMRTAAAEALAMIATLHPERREEIIGILRDILASMVDRLPQMEACDGNFAGMAVSIAEDLNATELLPEIEALYATGCVDRGVCGDINEVKEFFSTPEDYTTEQYQFPDIHQQLDELKRGINNW